MEAAICMCPEAWAPWLPEGALGLRDPGALARRDWDLLALTPEACRNPPEARCRLLLAPGDQPQALGRVQARAVISYGLSLRDTLTLSSLAAPTLCLQRAVPPLEPQEIPLPPLPGPPEALLPLLGLRLLSGLPPWPPSGDLRF